MGRDALRDSLHPERALVAAEGQGARWFAHDGSLHVFHEGFIPRHVEGSLAARLLAAVNLHGHGFARFGSQMAFSAGCQSQGCGAALHVRSAAAQELPVRNFAFQGIKIPGGRAQGHGINMAAKKERRSFPDAGREAAPLRIGGIIEIESNTETCLLKKRGQDIKGCPFVAAGDGVAADEFLGKRYGIVCPLHDVFSRRGPPRGGAPINPV